MYSKTPSGKSRKGQITVRPDAGSIKACFPRGYFEDGKQVKLATGIPNDENWESSAKRLERRLQQELEDRKLDDGNGNFNIGRYQEILEDYGLRAKLRLIKNAETSDSQLPPKPELSILEVWDMYCEYIKPSMKESTYFELVRGQYTNYVKSSIKAVGCEDADKIRNWLIENRFLLTVKKTLSHLSKAYQRAIRNKQVTYDPFNGMAEEIKQLGAKGKKQSEIEINNDKDILDKNKAYTWTEAQAILDYIKNNEKTNYLYPFVGFKFLTGCRTGEAIAFMWGDVFWDKQEIAIRWTYNHKIKKFLPTKNETARRFPMPKNGELWNLLKLIPEGKPNDVVFKSKTGKVINDDFVGRLWIGYAPNKTKGIIPALIEQGILKKYLPLYNTRHTFITHQVFDLGRDEKIVSAWCGHGEMVSQKHYQDIADRASQINPELPANNQQIQQTNSEVESLKEIIKSLQNQLQAQQELIASLQSKLDK